MVPGAGALSAVFVIVAESTAFTGFTEIAIVVVFNIMDLDDNICCDPAVMIFVFEDEVVIAAYWLCNCFS